MASMASSQLIIHGLPRTQATALRKKAERVGLSAEDYVRDLIAMDLELDLVASTKSFDELTMPFQKSLEGMSEADSDRLARPRRLKAKR